MTEKQIEAIDFYLRNDYLIINSILWNNYEDFNAKIDKVINCNNAMIKEALEIGIQKYWDNDLEKAQKQLGIFQKRSYDKLDGEAKKEIVSRAKEDIKLILSAMSPLKENLVLYRNVHKKFANDMNKHLITKMLGFSSCSTTQHIPHDKMYGSENCVTYKIFVPKGFYALRLDQMPDLCNEPDEVILPPMECEIKSIKQINNRKIIEVEAIKELRKIKNNNLEK